MSRVLVVDDEPSVRFTLEEVLVERGHTVSTAADGELALQAMATDEPPDVVVSDLVMPNSTDWLCSADSTRSSRRFR